MVLALLDCTMDSSRYLNRSLSPGNSTMLLAQLSVIPTAVLPIKLLATYCMGQTTMATHVLVLLLVLGLWQCQMLDAVSAAVVHTKLLRIVHRHAAMVIDSHRGTSR